MAGYGLMPNGRHEPRGRGTHRDDERRSCHSSRAEKECEVAKWAREPTELVSSRPAYNLDQYAPGPGVLFLLSSRSYEAQREALEKAADCELLFLECTCAPTAAIRVYGAAGPGDSLPCAPFS
jgi:hypothetical protein